MVAGAAVVTLGAVVLQVQFVDATGDAVVTLNVVLLDGGGVARTVVVDKRRVVCLPAFLELLSGAVVVTSAAVVLAPGLISGAAVATSAGVVSEPGVVSGDVVVTSAEVIGGGDGDRGALSFLSDGASIVCSLTVAEREERNNKLAQGK